MVASNVLGEKIFDVNKDAYRSIIDFSEGSQVVSETVALNQNLYDNIVFVNGATTYNSDSDSSAIEMVIMKDLKMYLFIILFLVMDGILCQLLIQ